MLDKKILLPGREVKLEKTTNHIRGLVHDSLKIKLSTGYKKIVKSSIE